MSHGPIDWDNPPSTRRQGDHGQRRLFYDLAVTAATATILYILVGALTGRGGVSEIGLRRYLVDAVPGARALAWGVVAVAAVTARS